MTSLLSVDSSVLGGIWPPERIVVGLRVSRSLRRILLDNVRRVALCRSPKTGGKQYLELSSSHVKNSLSQFHGGQLELEVTVRKSMRFMNAFLPALLEAASEGGATVTQLDLSANKLADDEADQFALNLVVGVCTSLTTLKLAKNKLNSSSLFMNLAPSIGGCSSLTHLELRQNNIDNPALERLSGVLMRYCSSLRHLGLSWNNFSSGGAKVMATALEGSSSLEELKLDGNPIEDDTAVHILEHLGCLTALSLSDTLVRARGWGELRCWKLAKLNLSFCDLEGALEASTVLSACPALTNLDLCGCGLSSVSLPGGAWGAGVAGQTCAVTELNLSDNVLGRGGARECCDVLSRCVALTDLNLSDNAIGDDGARSIASVVLPALTLLERLDMGRNELSVRGAVMVAEALTSCQHLQRLSLQGNQVGLQGAEVLGALPYGWRLAGLDLASCSLRPHAGSSPSSLEAQFAPLAQLLQRTRSLTALSLSSNVLPLEHLPAVLSALARLSALSALQLSNLHCGPLSVAALCSAIQDLPGLTQLDLSSMPLFTPTTPPQPEGREHCVAALLQRSSSLTDLDISRPKASAPAEACAAHVAALLRAGWRLRRLSLCGCPSQLDGAVSEALAQCRSLRRLDITADALVRCRAARERGGAGKGAGEGGRGRGGGDAGQGLAALVGLVRGSTALVRLFVDGSVRDGEEAELASECYRRDVELRWKARSVFDSESESDMAESDDDYY